MSDNLVDRVHKLEEGIRFWKGIALGLAGALAFILALGAGAGVLLFSRAAVDRDNAERMAREAEMHQHMALKAVQEAEAQQQRAEQEARAAKKLQNAK